MEEDWMAKEAQEVLEDLEDQEDQVVLTNQTQQPPSSLSYQLQM